MIRSSILLFLTYFLLQTEVFPQQYRWRLGVATGYTNYYGQLSTYRLQQLADIPEAFRTSFPLVPESNWNMSLEKRLRAGLGLSIHGGRQAFAGNGVPFSNGSPKQYHSTHYESSLWNIGSALIFRMDNGKILPETSLLAPYGLIGMGWRTWESQTLKPVAGSPLQDSSGGEKALVTGQDQSGERTYLDMGLGLRLRVSRQFELFIQSNAQTNGAQLFTAPGAFFSPAGIRNQPVQRGPEREWLFQHQLGIKFSFAPNRASFKASIISPSATTYREAPRSETSPSSGINPSLPDTIQNTAAPELFIPADPSGENPGTMDSLESPIADYYFQGAVASEKKIPALDSVENRYFQIESRAYYPEFDYSNDEMEQPLTPTTFYRAYPDYPEPYSNFQVYPESYADFRKRNQQEQRIRSLPSERYSNTKQNQSSSRVFVPVIAPLVRRPAAEAADPDVTERASDLPLVSPASPDSLSIKTGLRLNPAVPIRSEPFPLPGSKLPEIVILNETRDTITTELSLPALYTDIYFEINQSELSEAALTKLEEVAHTLRRFPDAMVSLKGYADHTGSITFNLNLVEKRTLSVAGALEEEFGIANDRIQRQPGAQLVRTRVPSAQPEDRKVEVQILFLNSGVD